MLITSRNNGSRTEKRTTGDVSLFGTLLVLCLLLTSCSFEYKSRTVPENGDFPGYILNDTVYTVSRAHLDLISFTAQKASFYLKDSTVLLEGVTFTQSSPQGEVLTEGTCDTGRIDTNTNDVVLEGNVELLSLTESTRITADRLYWDQQQNLLRGDQEGTVVLYYRDGSQVSGEDFRADVSERVFEFSEVSEGVVRYE